MVWKKSWNKVLNLLGQGTYGLIASEFAKSASSEI